MQHAAPYNVKLHTPVEKVRATDLEREPQAAKDEPRWHTQSLLRHVPAEGHEHRVKVAA